MNKKWSEARGVFDYQNEEFKRNVNDKSWKRHGKLIHDIKLKENEEKENNLMKRN